MIISSPAFFSEANIPHKFTCDGGDINPELIIQHVPENARSLALIVDDPDAPGGTFTHWTVWSIDPRIRIIKEESVPPGSVEGATDFGRTGYGGPCPPSGEHRYFFRLYALDSVLPLPHGASLAALREAMEGHILAEASLMGRYKRQQ